MALFGAKVVPADQADLREEVADMKRKEKLRKKYGATCTEEQLAFYQGEEDKQVERVRLRKEGDEAGRIASLKRKEEIEMLAVKMVAEGRILIQVRGTRINAVDKEFKVPCACGSSLSVYNPLYMFAEMWLTTAPADRFSGYSPLIIYNARNPLGNLLGAPLHMSVVDCQVCKKSTLVVVQLVVL